MRVRVYYKAGTMDCYTIVVEDRQTDGDGRAWYPMWFCGRYGMDSINGYAGDYYPGVDDSRCLGKKVPSGKVPNEVKEFIDNII